MHDHRVETGIGQRQIGKIALHQLDLGGGQMLQLGARDPQHFEVLVERHDPLRAGGEQLGHAARAGADIEQVAQRRIGQRFEQMAFDIGVGTVERAQLVPFAGVAGEILFGRRFAGVANRGEFLAVALAQRGKGGLFGFGDGEQVLHRFQHRSARFCLTQEHPAAFTAAFGQPRIAQDADMARHPRLALPEHLRQFPDSQLHRAEQAGDA